MKKFAVFMIMLCLALTLAGTGECRDVKDGLKIGATGPFTGAAAAPGMEIFNSIKTGAWMK